MKWCKESGGVERFLVLWWETADEVWYIPERSDEWNMFVDEMIVDF